MKFEEISIGSADYEAALRLRETVLRIPLGLTLTKADTADESDSIHLGSFEGENLVAVLVLKPLDESTVKMRQVAVAPEMQGRGIGSRLIAFAEAFARERGYQRMVAHARGTATEFYRRIGYTTSGETFIETTIPHIFVSKSL